MVLHIVQEPEMAKKKKAVNKPAVSVTGDTEPTGDVVATTPEDDVVVTETAPMKPSNVSLVSGSVMVLRGGKWPKDYKFRIGNNPWEYLDDKESFLKALGDALPD